MKNKKNHHGAPSILLVDGQCLLCNGITHFVVKRDKANLFRFATLQSPLGQQLLLECKLPTEVLDTFVMVQQGSFLIKSDAALHVLVRLGGWWRFAVVGKIVPRVLRNAAYDLIARNRYRWFGRATHCILPTPDLISRFMDGQMQPADVKAEGDGDE
ncbi:thiol-disulfide oxidoreductase DCC family protein [Paenibacillus luteus]|uniref:thiol-disulfide oxidoreductase DCC family protein n=1 Tax=Paenibacillus luteus TaxID=2545753 RepID=UPI0013761E0A|nr:DCC1-like thiol-disulfide oxidoreductase family protein [Paenibacillus luteus]